jgi:hypothetical protein
LTLKKFLIFGLQLVYEFSEVRPFAVCRCCVVAVGLQLTTGTNRRRAGADSDFASTGSTSDT